MVVTTSACAPYATGFYYGSAYVEFPTLEVGTGDSPTSTLPIVMFLRVVC